MFVTKNENAAAEFASRFSNWYPNFFGCYWHSRSLWYWKKTRRQQKVALLRNDNKTKPSTIRTKTSFVQGAGLIWIKKKSEWPPPIHDGRYNWCARADLFRAWGKWNTRSEVVSSLVHHTLDPPFYFKLRYFCAFILTIPAKYRIEWYWATGPANTFFEQPFHWDNRFTISTLITIFI